MSVEQQIQEFQNQLLQKYCQLLDEQLYKIKSSVEDWNDLILKNDKDEDLKPFIRQLGEYEEGFYFQYLVSEGVKNTGQIKAVQYLDKSKSSITEIVAV